LVHTENFVKEGFTFAPQNPRELEIDPPIYTKPLTSLDIPLDTIHKNQIPPKMPTSR